MKSPFFDRRSAALLGDQIRDYCSLTDFIQAITTLIQRWSCSMLREVIARLFNPPPIPLAEVSNLWSKLSADDKLVVLEVARKLVATADK